MAETTDQPTITLRYQWACGAFGQWGLRDREECGIDKCEGPHSDTLTVGRLVDLNGQPLDG